MEKSYEALLEVVLYIAAYPPKAELLKDIALLCNGEVIFDGFYECYSFNYILFICKWLGERKNPLKPWG